MIRFLVFCISMLVCSSSAQALDLPSAIQPYRLEHFPTQEQLLIRLKDLKAKALSKPDNSQILVNLAEVEGQLGDLDQAIKHGRSAANYAPEDFRVHLVLARLFLLDRNALAARLQAERALELMGKTGDRTAARCLQITALIDLKELSKADKLSASEFKKSPKDARLAFLRGWVLAANQEKAAQEAALSAYRQSLILDPSMNESHYNLGLLLAQQGQNKAAIAELTTYLSSSSGTSSSSTAKLAEDLISKLAHQD
ncbi:MAG: tetratricopeptide repeat protein [Candidatus Obscuribacterales bacterium]|nr:tetratricopeptide repeat protein [Candidatus Obscuribacterales bacterium]